VLATNMENEYKAMLTKSLTEHVALDVLEQASFGYNHDQIAAMALHEFRLPLQHENVLTHFHQANTDELDAGMAKERAVLGLAHHLLAEVGEVPGFTETLFDNTAVLCEELDINEDTLVRLREQAAEILSESAA